MDVFDRLAAVAATKLFPKSIDPAVFGHPLALKTEWTPCAGAGLSFGSHRLIASADGGLEFKRTRAYFAYAAVYLSVAIALGCFGLITGLLLAVPFGIPFALVGLALLWPAPRRFDVARRQFVGRDWRLPFERILALQLLPELVSGDSGSFTSYELNLVIEDGWRINVVDHGNLEVLREDAARLQALLRCPLWDAAGL